MNGLMTLCLVGPAGQARRGRNDAWLLPRVRPWAFERGGLRCGWRCWAIGSCCKAVKETCTLHQKSRQC